MPPLSGKLPKKKNTTDHGEPRMHEHCAVLDAVTVADNRSWTIET